ncbi:hypothetical protein AX13_01460 [Comamonas aquatica DA1877]|uniref:Uncharacterized protein n=1 Tax=Comamonas aquatica DA1877 TaxID=1457173 RepID=A0A014MED0_9BURK|nr:hypothetical protein AX13_01460 [Comamonas aquatica DA1877]
MILKKNLASAFDAANINSIQVIYDTAKYTQALIHR